MFHRHKWVVITTQNVIVSGDYSLANGINTLILQKCSVCSKYTSYRIQGHFADKIK